MNHTDIVEGLSAVLTNRKLISPADMIDLEKEFHGRSDIAFEDFLLETGIN